MNVDESNSYSNTKDATCRNVNVMATAMNLVDKLSMDERLGP